MPHRHTAVVALAIALLAGACSGSFATEFTFDEPVSAVVVNVGDSDIIITGSTSISGAEVSIEASARADDVELDVGVEGGTLGITHDCLGGSACTVDYNITVAEGASVSITSDAGDISIADITASVAVNVRAGNVFVTSVTGEFTAAVEVGNITGTRLDSDSVSATASVGNIDITVDEQIPFLTATTDVGNITVQLPSGPYALEATSPSSEPDIRIDTDPTSDLTVSLTTGDGDIIVYRK